MRKELTLKYGLHMDNNKENVKRNRLKEPDKTKYRLYDILKIEVGRCGNWNVLVANLNRQGMEVRFRHKWQMDEARVSFSPRTVTTSTGPKWTGVSAIPRLTLPCSATGARTTQVHKIATPNAPSATIHAEFFSGSLGLLNGNASSYNTADAIANLEMAEMLRRKNTNEE